MKTSLREKIVFMRYICSLYMYDRLQSIHVCTSRTVALTHTVYSVSGRAGTVLVHAQSFKLCACTVYVK